MLLKQLITEGAKEVAIEDFLKNLIRGTEWENKIFIAGGYVRDFIMGKDPKDLDVMVNKPNGGIEFANWITSKYDLHPPVIFPRFGTAKFNLNGVVHNGMDLSGTDIESVMTRSENYTAGSRKPEVGFSDLKGDAERRDLTVNSLFKNLSTGEILDLTGKGMDDIKNGIVRTPLEPSKTFTDDPLRMLRVIRFYAKYNWNIPLNIIKALKANASQLQNISEERIQDELNKMLTTSNPDKAVKLLKVTNLLQYVIPELKQAIKMTQNHHHKMDVFGHTLDVLRKTQPVLVQRLMALFHDIGKVVTRSVTPTGVHFYGHEHAGAEMTEKIMRRLKYPTEIINAVKTGVENHMRLKHGGDTTVDLSDKTLRKFVADVGDQLENVLHVIHADNIAHSEASSMPNQVEFVKNRLKSLETTSSKPKLPINGFDLQKELGLKPGKIFGEIMTAITDAWYEDPKLTRDKALEIARGIIGKPTQSVVKEGKYIDHIDQQINALEKEWDRIDSQGTGTERQQNIQKELEQLKRFREDWEKLYKAAGIDIKNKPFAVFIVAKVNGGYAATTRASDRGESGKIGLPGGKMDQNETPINAVIRESREEGWEIQDVDETIFHQQLVDGKMVWWYKAESAKMLTNYKEKGRITPVVITREQLLKSGYGNENLKI